ncbi:MAG: hypothetical protein ABMB14_09145, partial [Myxococcota bacterium]
APPAPLEAWFDQIGVAARSLGLTTVRRHLWSKANGALIDTDPALPRPPEAVKWVGEDVWASGPGAALFVAPAEGLYDVAAALDRTDGARAWILVGTPATAQLASCCTTHRLGSGELAERKPSPGKGAPPIARWEPSRPPDPLRRATYDGKCRPWPPPGPSLEAFTRDLGLHLASR